MLDSLHTFDWGGQWFSLVASERFIISHINTHDSYKPHWFIWLFNSHCLVVSTPENYETHVFTDQEKKKQWKTYQNWTPKLKFLRNNLNLKPRKTTSGCHLQLAERCPTSCFKLDNNLYELAICFKMHLDRDKIIAMSIFKKELKLLVLSARVSLFYLSQLLKTFEFDTEKPMSHAPQDQP